MAGIVCSGTKDEVHTVDLKASHMLMLCFVGVESCTMQNLCPTVMCSPIADSSLLWMSVVASEGLLALACCWLDPRKGIPYLQDETGQRLEVDSCSPSFLLRSDSLQMLCWILFPSCVGIVRHRKEIGLFHFRCANFSSPLL